MNAPMTAERARVLAAKFCPPRSPEPPPPPLPRGSFPSCHGTSRRILAWLTSRGPSTYKSVARGLGILPRTASTVLIRMAERGILEIVHKGRGHGDPSVYGVRKEKA